MTRAAAEAAVDTLLEYIEPKTFEREGLQRTAFRVIKSFEEIFEGYLMDPRDILSRVFEEGHDSMVIVRDIPFYSTCEHHMIPFFGTVDIGYVPDGGRVVGLSKLARLVDCYAKRLQVQERMTGQIVDALEKYLHPRGSMCVIRAEHLCMCARGIKKPGSQTITSSVHGVFAEKGDPRSEFLHLTDTQR